ncbi:MAG: glycogen/starch synthase [Candidatus Omnitrophica bacterium]|nr:glycogen/starch synthase [Candidatus Omnitrophota bacterium]
MKTLQKTLCCCVIVSFIVTSLFNPSVFAQNVSQENLTKLLITLPTPGTRVDLSPAFNPVVIRGLKIHPENPFLFDFIVDPGDDHLKGEGLRTPVQRLVNYFLAALAVPEKDLWVNLSPVERNRIIPDSLNKTELGRDLLAEDYILKQVSASLIYPESHLGKVFWAKVYEEAYKKFGKTQVPVNIFNKVWILPEKASVYEKGNSVYIVNAHLKVMLDDDLMAQGLLGKKGSSGSKVSGVKDVSTDVMRQVILPAIDKEINEGKNFAQVRQSFYSLILAQWYRDVFKASILNKDYAGRNKVAGIDYSDPKNKNVIYQKYLAAYRKGVFNYIKDETSLLTQSPLPRKYFSGGFDGMHRVERDSVSLPGTTAAMASSVNVRVNIEPLTQHASAAMIPAELPPDDIWFSFQFPQKVLLPLLIDCLSSPHYFNKDKLFAFIEKYSQKVAAQRKSPVEGAWPVLKAITLLSKRQEADLVGILQKRYPDLKNRPLLVDKILLMNNVVDKENWLKQRTPHLQGRRIYLTAAEIHYWSGGLGPVMKFHGKGMKDLGADVCYVEPRYQLGKNVPIAKYKIAEALGSNYLQNLISVGFLHEVSSLEVKPNLQGGVLQDYELEQAVGLDIGRQIVGVLVKSQYAEIIGQTELHLSRNVSENEIIWNLGEHHFPEEVKVAFQKLIQRSKKVLQDDEVLRALGSDKARKFWSILPQKLDYRNANIKIHDLEEDVDEFVIEMGNTDPWGNKLEGMVVKEALSSDPKKAETIWDALQRGGIIDFMGQYAGQRMFDETTIRNLLDLPGISDQEKKDVSEMLLRVVRENLKQVRVKVAKGVDENGITVYLFKDVGFDGVSSYYTKMLYSYHKPDNPISQEQSMAFINIATAELINRLERQRQQDDPDWKPAIVHANDGQYGPLQAVMQSRHGHNNWMANIIYAATTHTYQNRGGNVVEFGINTFLRFMLRVKERFISAFRRGFNWIDFTSGGLRLAHWAGGVSQKQSNDVNPLDPHTNVVGITNGAVPEEMAAVYRQTFKELQKIGAIPQDADYERPTWEENAKTKEACRVKLNNADIRTANGGTLRVGNGPIIGYARRLVPEKAGRTRRNLDRTVEPGAFSDTNIKRMVALGYEVVLLGNIQGSDESEDLAAGLRSLEREIRRLKHNDPNTYKGNFQFVESFTPQDKVLFEAAVNIQIQDSWPSTGACEFSEEDSTATGGVQGGTDEGVIQRQGIPLKYREKDKEHEQPVGQTVFPAEYTEDSWYNTVFKPLKEYWDRDRDHRTFYEHAALSPRLNRIQNYLLTSADYLMEYQKVIELQERIAVEDTQALNAIVNDLQQNHASDINEIVYNSHGIGPFGFDIYGVRAENGGLRSFLDARNGLENTVGYDALLHYTQRGDIQNYLKALFRNTGQSQQILSHWLDRVARDEDLSLDQKNQRLGQFIEQLTLSLEVAGVNHAMAPGGIKLDNIDIEKHGSLTANLVTNKTLEDMLIQSAGVRGDIMAITAIPNLMEFIVK